MAKKIEVSTETFVRFWLVIVAFLVVMAFVQAAGAALLVVGAAVFLAVAINPLVNMINKSGKRRALSAILAVLLVVGVIGGIVAAVGPVVVNETKGYFAENPGASSGFERGTRVLNGIGNSLGIEDFSGQVWNGMKNIYDEFVANIGKTIMSGVGAVVNLVVGVIMTVVLTIVFLIEGPDLLDKFWKMVAVKRKDASRVWREVVTKMADVVSKYVTGQLTVAILDGIMVTSVVAILSMIFHFSMGLAVPMGLTTMTCYMIPMVGPIIGTIVVALLLFFSSPGAALTFMIFYLIYQQIESNILAPKIQGNKLDLPMSAILVAIVIGMYVFGILGAIISIPIAGCIRVLIMEYPKIRKLHG